MTSGRDHRFDLVAGMVARGALGAAFLSSVADRFGLWGSHGERGVMWGDFSHFTAAVHRLNWFAPQGFIPALAWCATICEAVFGIGLIVGLWTRVFALSSSGLLLLFAAAMSAAQGFKSVLDYSVPSATAAAFMLACRPSSLWSVDRWLTSRRKKSSCFD